MNVRNFVFRKAGFGVLTLIMLLLAPAGRAAAVPSAAPPAGDLAAAGSTLGVARAGGTSLYDAAGKPILELPADATSTEVDLPSALQNSNVLVEVTGGGKTRSQAYYANALDVQVVENYGQIQVRHATSKQPLGKVYVKVYARMKDGSVAFYKDGYTDLRGRFDYTSLSTDQLDSVARFSLLIFSEENGAVIREADPPKR